MAKAMRDKFIAIISLVALRGQIMTVKAHPGLCMKYSRWVIYFVKLPFAEVVAKFHSPACPKTVCRNSRHLCGFQAGTCQYSVYIIEI